MSDIEIEHRLTAVETRYMGFMERYERDRDADEKRWRKVDEMHELMLEARGAARAARWIGHGLTAAIAFTVSTLGGYLHLPPR